MCDHMYDSHHSCSKLASQREWSFWVGEKKRESCFSGKTAKDST